MLLLFNLATDYRSRAIWNNKKTATNLTQKNHIIFTFWFLTHFKLRPIELNDRRKKSNWSLKNSFTKFEDYCNEFTTANDAASARQCACVTTTLWNIKKKFFFVSTVARKKYLLFLFLPSWNEFDITQQQRRLTTRRRSEKALVNGVVRSKLRASSKIEEFQSKRTKKKQNQMYYYF